MSDIVFDVFDLSTDPDASGGPVASFSVDLGTGATGPKGDQGIQGVQGVKGDTGSAGASGTDGQDGQDGADGQGVPVGGTTAQALVKASDADFDTEWADQTGGGGGAVDSVNGQTGVVVLAASDVGAATTAQGALADSATQPGDLGTAAAANTGDFDAAGAAATAQTTAEGYTDAAVSGLVPNTRTVAGHALSANVTVSKGDVGLGNVDNTADASKSFTASQISDSTTVGRAVVVAVDAAAGRSAIGAGTSSLALGTSSSTAKAGDYQPASTNISDATTVGKAVLTGTNAAAVRTTLGLGTAAVVDTGTSSGNVPLLSTGGLLPIARIASGTADGTKFVRDDGTLVTPSGGGGGWDVNVNLPLSTLTGWTAGAGTWTVASSVIKQTATTATAQRLHYNTLVPLNNVVAEWEQRIDAAAAGQAGIVFGTPKSSDGDWGFLAGFTITSTQTTAAYTEVDNQVAGSNITLGSAIAHTNWYKVKVHKSGSWCTYWLDTGSGYVLLGAMELDGPNRAFGRIALKTYNAQASFRNLKVWSLTLPT